MEVEISYLIFFFEWKNSQDSLIAPLPFQISTSILHKLGDLFEPKQIYRSTKAPFLKPNHCNLI